MSRRPLSIETRWTLRYGATLLVCISAFAFYAYARIERRLEQDAAVLLLLQANQVQAEAARFSTDDASLAALLERRVSSAESGLRLGVAVYSPEGARRAAAGPLATVPVRLPEGVLRRTDSEIIERRDLGRSYTWRVVTQRSPAAIVQVAVYARRFERNVRYVRRIFIVALPAVLIATAGIGWWLARGSLRPIARMTAATRRISGSNLDERIPRSGTGDQLDQLAETLDDMTARLRESVLRMRRFAGDAAHELRTPLAALRSRIEVTLLRQSSPDEMKDTLIGARDEVDRLAETVSAMLRLARSEAGIDPARRSDVALAPLLRDVVGFFDPVAEDGGVQLCAGDLPDVTVPGDAEWLHQLFANLVHNAVRYTPAGGEVMVEGWLEPSGSASRTPVTQGPRESRGSVLRTPVTQGPSEPRGVVLRTPVTQGLREDADAADHDAVSTGAAAARCVVIRVRDTGIGIAPADHARIFERFYRGSAAASRGGTGLGLPIAREIARAHGGDITVASTDGNGASFIVRLQCES